jgi:alpha-ketoglutarate-dependent taurine dioxygenase
MVNYKIHSNGWTVILEDFDFTQATQDDINHIARLLASNTLVVVKKQMLSVEDEVKIVKMFKNPQQFFTDDPTSPDYNFKGSEVPGSENMALRVSGEKDQDGNTGIAGHESEMFWHANDQTTPERRSLVWLYGIRGTKGSRTTWNNNILSYESLEREKRDPLENLKLDILKNVSLREDEADGVEKIEEYAPNLVMENIAGKRGFYFPFLQISGFKDMSEKESKKIIDWLSEYTTQDKFCYHHDWEDGDVVIAEQWLGIHKRWPFKEIENRLLHRMAFEFPDQDYKRIA